MTVAPRRNRASPPAAAKLGSEPGSDTPCHRRVPGGIPVWRCGCAWGLVVVRNHSLLGPCIGAVTAFRYSHLSRSARSFPSRTMGVPPNLVARLKNAEHRPGDRSLPHKYSNPTSRIRSGFCLFSAFHGAGTFDFTRGCPPKRLVVQTLAVALWFRWLSLSAFMFLRRSKRVKDGKEHFYRSVVKPRDEAASRRLPRRGERREAARSRIADCTEAASCNATSSTSEHAMADRRLHGARAWITSGRMRMLRSRWPSFPRNMPRCNPATKSCPSCACGSPGWCCEGRVRGVPAGWAASCGSNSDSIPSGASNCPPAAKARVGIWCCKPSCSIA